MSEATATHRRLPLYVVLAASFISLAGNMMTFLAVPWFVLETTDSASRTGIAAFFFLLPVPIAGVFGGVLVDRIGFKPSSIIADVASGVTVATIPLLHATVGLHFWQLLVLIFLGALLDSPGQNARANMIPELASFAGVSLERASSAMQVVERGARLLGAPLAGVLIALIGAENVLWLDAATFAVSAALIAAVAPGAIALAEKEPSTSYLSELLEGYRYLRIRPFMLAVILTITATNFLDSFGMVLLPVYSERVIESAVALGVIYAFTAGGSVLGAVVFGAIGEGWPRLRTFATCFLLSGVLWWLFVLQLPLPVLLAGALASGLAAGPINPLLMTIFFERVPTNLRGRIFGIANAMAWLVMPVGAVLAGALIEVVGLTATFALVAIAYLGVTLVAFVNPWLREMDDRPAGAIERPVEAVEAS